jgi:hypothetical protein
MTDPETLSAGMVCAARKLLKSSASIEQELRRTLDKCDSLSDSLCQAVSETLTKLCQDISGALLVLYQRNKDPSLLQASLVCFGQVLRRIKPETLRSQHDLEAALLAAHNFCHKEGISRELHRICEILIGETFWCFQRLEQIFKPPLVHKLRNARVLRERVVRFLGNTREDLLVVSFCLLKLTVCLRALEDGSFKIHEGDKILIGKLLAEATSHERAFSVLLPQQKGLLLEGLEMTGGSPVDP